MVRRTMPSLMRHCGATLNESTFYDQNLIVRPRTTRQKEGQPTNGSGSLVQRDHLGSSGRFLLPLRYIILIHIFETEFAQRVECPEL